MEFNKLYGVSSSGKVKEWQIFVLDKKTEAHVVIKHGYIDGKKIENIQVITKGKNLGRLNETTVLQQAISEAKSKWNKKKDSGYTEKIKDTKVPTEIPLPMLALNYTKRSGDIVFPCYVQPKLDGVRAIGSKSSLYSRKGKEFLFLDEIKKEIGKYFPKEILLDGEIYSDTLSFQELTGLVRKKKLDEVSVEKMKQVQFVVYDSLISRTPFKKRHLILENIFKEHSKHLKHILLLKTEICKSREEVTEFLKKYEKQGYEGLILRNFEGEYAINQRSKNLQKLKSFVDDEFEIISSTDGVGIERGLVIWIVKTKKGNEFRVRPQGTHEERAALFKNAKKYIGKFLTVKYQELTDDGLPRFPVGMGIRDYE